MKRIVLLTRHPEPGEVKTRLIAALGKEGAAEVHRQLTEKTVGTLRSLPPDIGLDIYYSGGNNEAMRGWLGKDLHYINQPPGPLGHRLTLRAAEAFAGKTSRLLFIGSDCPTLTIGDLLQAFDVLEKNPVVLGPATDGGYYLIGLRFYEPRLFTGIPWGTTGVLAATLDRCRQLDLPYRLLPSRADVDRPEDLELLPMLQKIN
ncbi:MAG: TIGR04282 family arsenosugar biosynthesis glycosyltransferase [Deltaproteobacteria bacterium]